MQTILALIALAFGAAILLLAFHLLRTRYALPDEEALKREERNREIMKAIDELKSRRVNTLAEWEDFEPHYN